FLYSHHHYDYIGDPSTFPDSIDHIVGPGFIDAFVPEYPENPNSPPLQRDIEGRKIHLLSFADPDLVLGVFPAIVFLGDTRFFILDVPGHSINHLCALCRTTASPGATFLFLACSYYGSQFRPSVKLTLPLD
ncbi:hypothetical protein K432DRAFT_266260, partial [Lepidopterella palustris CBS 459.81]